MNRKRDMLVSVVLPLHCAADVVDECLDEIVSVLRANFEEYEVVVVDDRSTDATVARVTQALARYPHLRLLLLSRAFGGDEAIFAGLDSAIGDVVVVLDAYEDPPAEIPALVDAEFRHGGVVVGRCRSARGRGLSGRLLRRVTERLLRVDLRALGQTCYAFQRHVATEINQLKNTFRRMPVILDTLSTPTTELAFTSRPQRAQRRSAGLLDRFSRAASHIVAQSSHPLRLVSRLGLLASLINVMYVGYIFVVHLVKNDVAEGWTTLSLQISVMMTLMFLILLVIGEYLAQVLEEARGRVPYHIVEERNSSVLDERGEERNVVGQSIDSRAA